SRGGEYPFVDDLLESCCTPVKGGDLVIIGSIKRGSVAVRLTEKDGKPAAEEAWKNPELKCYFSTPMPVGKDFIYTVTGKLPPTPSIKLHCVETATGKVRWTKPDIGKYHAALVRT